MSRSIPSPDPGAGALWVCWAPPLRDLGGSDKLLSFLPPAQEELLARRYRDRFLRAREASRGVRADARELYVDFVAHLGLARMRDGRTLREALLQPGRKASRWWYHPVTFRDCEDVPIFDRIIAVLTIQAVAERSGIKRLVMVGAPADVVSVLRQKYFIIARRNRRAAGAWGVALLALASRARYGLRALWRWMAVRKALGNSAPPSLEIALSGFWDWSVWQDPAIDSTVDRYFRKLPGLLRRHGRRIGWFAWFDPAGDPAKPARPLSKVLAAAARRRDVVILQRFLRPWDIVRAVIDLSAAGLYFTIRRDPALRQACLRDGVDWSALFQSQLLRGFLDATLPHHELVASATERACRQCGPLATVSFLEHAPHSRAHYEGVQRAGGAAKCYAVQHASYNHEKTFLCLHPSFEFEGKPDGCAAPHPDTIFAMGSLGQRLFLECGYPEDQVLLTGSTRYDALRGCDAGSADRAVDVKSLPDVSDQPLRILLACGLNTDVEFDMVQALCEAARGINGVALLLRSHPFCRMDRAPGWARYKDRVAITQGSLEDDLAQADLLVFTYSTVAEEAFIAGKRVWQWLPLGFNASALAEVADIPRFSSVDQLRDALRALCKSPRSFQPSPQAIQAAKEQLFYQTDGQAAERVAAVILERLGAPRSEALDVVVSHS